MNYVIFHHNDMDGYCSANIIAYDIYAKDKNAHIEAIKCNYDDKYPCTKFIRTKGAIDKIYIVDISIGEKQRKNIDKLYSRAREVIIIDHHLTSIETYYPEVASKDLRYYEYIDTENNIYLSAEYCATVLCWAYTHDMNLSDIKTASYSIIPFFVNYVDSWDLFTFRQNKTREFKVGFEYYRNNWNPVLKHNIIKDLIKSYEDDHDNEQFTLLASKEMDLIIDIISKGEIMNKAINSLYEKILSNTYMGRFLNYNALIVNTCVYDGFLFRNNMYLENFISDRADISNIDIFVAYYEHYKNGNKIYTYSLYDNNNSDINCADIAKQFGGGGHKGAARFTTTLSLSELNEKKENPFSKLNNFINKLLKR